MSTQLLIDPADELTRRLLGGASGVAAGLLLERGFVGISPSPVVDDATRRQFIVGGVSLAALLAGCGDSTPAPTGQTDAGWSFTDDRGVTVNLPSRPTRIAAYGTAGAALAYLGVRPVAIFDGSPLDQNPSLEGVNLAGIESVGETYGEINLEKLAALQIDLVVTAYDPRQDGPVFGFVDGPVQGQVEDIAPIVALDGIRDPIDVIARYEELAASLGADLQAPEIAAARQDYEDAAAELSAALAEKPGLIAVAVYATPSDGVTFWRPAQAPGLRQLQELGLDLVEPEGDPGDINEDFATFFGDSVSLELAGKYPADVILFDSRYDPADMAGVATWAALPAVQADQVVPFRALESWSYQAYAGDFRLITAAVRAANPDLV